MLDGDFDFFGTDLAELTLESFDGSEHITFDNDGKFGFLLFRQHIENVVERDFLARKVALSLTWRRSSAAASACLRFFTQ